MSAAAARPVVEGVTVELTGSVYTPGLGTSPQGTRGTVLGLYGSEASVQVSSRASILAPLDHLAVIA